MPQAYDYAQRRRSQPNNPQRQSSPVTGRTDYSGTVDDPLILEYHGGRRFPRVFHGPSSRAMGIELENHFPSHPRNWGYLTGVLTEIITDYNRIRRPQSCDRIDDPRFMGEHVYRNDFTMEKDGSATGVEIVFQPRAFLNWMNYFSDDPIEVYPTDRGLGTWLLQRLSAAGFDCRYSYPNGEPYASNSFHIHVTKDWIRNADMVEWLRRTTREIPSRDILRITQRPTMGNLEFWAARGGSQDRRVFWNTNPRSTVECRGPRAQLRADRCRAKIEFVYAMVMGAEENLTNPLTTEDFINGLQLFPDAWELWNTPRPRERRGRE